MGKVILFGEPMALLIADTTGPLEEVEHFTRALSGAEVNVAIGLSRLGHKVEYLTRLGDDPFGHYIEATLKKNGIGTELITYDCVYRTGIQLKDRVEDGSDPHAPYYRKGSAASCISVKEIEELELSDVSLLHICVRLCGRMRKPCGRFLTNWQQKRMWCFRELRSAEFLWAPRRKKRLRTFIRGWECIR